MFTTKIGVINVNERKTINKNIKLHRKTATQIQSNQIENHIRYFAHKKVYAVVNWNINLYSNRMILFFEIRKSVNFYFQK